ncbi:MAG: histidine kinase N-terminal 7TM domain-containing protein [Clostridia bacterium]
MVIDTEFILLIISTLSIILLMGKIRRKKPVSQLQNAFATVLLTVLIISVGVIAQLVCTIFFNIEPIYFENFIYIGTCILPVALFFVSIIFRNTKIRFRKRYLLLFVIPFLTLAVLYTNQYHHLFYKIYSSNLNEMVYGPYFYVHSIYTYGLLLVSIGIMINASLKNSGAFSKQTMLIIIGTMFPILVNLLGTFKIYDMNVCLTPISFSIAVIFYTFSILKFNFLKITPIALQKIVDRISDGYVVLDEDNIITDFNKTFLSVFKLKPENLRSKNFIDFLNSRKISKQVISKIERSIQKANTTNETISFEQHFSEIKKYFKIEITPINSENSSLGTLFLFKDITQHKEDMQTIKNNQEILMEREF